MCDPLPIGDPGANAAGKKARQGYNRALLIRVYNVLEQSPDSGIGAYSGSSDRLVQAGKSEGFLE